MVPEKTSKQKLINDGERRAKVQWGLFESSLVPKDIIRHSVCGSTCRGTCESLVISVFSASLASSLVYSVDIARGMARYSGLAQSLDIHGK